MDVLKLGVEVLKGHVGVGICSSVALWSPLDVLNILGESHFLRVGLNGGELGGESIQVVVEPAMINYNEM